MEPTLIDVDAVHVSHFPIKVIVSPLGVWISPQDWNKDRLSLLWLELRQGRLRLVIRANRDDEQAMRVIDLLPAPEAPAEESDSSGYLLPFREHQPHQKGERRWKR
jgi:hypothetical protein